MPAVKDILPGRTLVIDTSVAAKWFLPEELSRDADEILEGARLNRLRLAAPDLIVYEFANILWQRQKKKEISSRQATLMMADFERLPIEMAPADVLGAAALKIASQSGCTAYDGAFIALAEGLGSLLLTADRRLLRMLSSSMYARFVAWLGDAC